MLKTYLLLVHYLFRTCSIFVKYLFTICSWLDIFRTCSRPIFHFSWIIHDLFMHCSKLVHNFLKIFSWFAHNFFNKPSFCSGNCDEIHVRRKLESKTSLKHWNFLETHLPFSLKFLETSFQTFWNCIEKPLKYHLIFFRYPESSLESSITFLETTLEFRWKLLETPLKLSSNTHWDS